MDYFELVTKRPFFEAEQSGVGNVVQRSVSKQLDQGLVIRDNGQDVEVRAPEDEVSCFVQCVNNGQGLSFNW